MLPHPIAHRAERFPRPDLRPVPGKLQLRKPKERHLPHQHPRIQLSIHPPDRVLFPRVVRADQRPSHQPAHPPHHIGLVPLHRIVRALHPFHAPRPQLIHRPARRLPQRPELIHRDHTRRRIRNPQPGRNLPGLHTRQLAQNIPRDPDRAPIIPHRAPSRQRQRRKRLLVHRRDLGLALPRHHIPRPHDPQRLHPGPALRSQIRHQPLPHHAHTRETHLTRLNHPTSTIQEHRPLPRPGLRHPHHLRPREREPPFQQLPNTRQRQTPIIPQLRRERIRRTRRIDPRRHEPVRGHHRAPIPQTHDQRIPPHRHPQVRARKVRVRDRDRAPPELERHREPLRERPPLLRRGLRVPPRTHRRASPRDRATRGQHQRIPVLRQRPTPTDHPTLESERHRRAPEPLHRLDPLVHRPRVHPTAHRVVRPDRLRRTGLPITQSRAQRESENTHPQPARAPEITSENDKPHNPIHGSAHHTQDSCTPRSP